MAIDLPFEPMQKPDPSFRVPDLAEVVLGWRCWSIKSDLPDYGLPPKLLSVAGTAGYFWKPRRESIAECKKKPNPCKHDDEDVSKRLPGDACGCGFYSAKTYKHLKTMSYWRYNEEQTGYFRIVGLVGNWGKVCEASYGWRAQKAYPLRLHVPYEAWPLVAPLKETYGCEVVIANFLKPYTKEQLGETLEDLKKAAAGMADGDE